MIVTTSSVKAEILADWPDRTPAPSGAEFDAYCGQVARLRDAQARLDAEGLIAEDARGNPIPHPAIKIERDAAEQLRRFGAKFTPRRTR